MIQTRPSATGLAEVLAVEQSRDGLVEATAGVFGDLRGLRLDPRIHYDQDSGALAAKILGAHHSAAGQAWQAAALLAGVPRGTAGPDRVDLAFDPVLDDLDRRIADPRRADPDDRPVLGDLVDYRELRRYFLRLREETARVRETAESDDGLVTAVAGGRGELLALALDQRVYRTGSTAALAEQILGTARRAATRASARLVAISGSITANEEAR